MDDPANVEIKKLYEAGLAQGLTPAAARKAAETTLRADVNSRDYNQSAAELLSGSYGADLDTDTQDTVIRARRKKLKDVTREDIDARTAEMYGETEVSTEEKLDQRRDAESMLRAEQRLRTAGLLDDDATLMGDLADASPQLKEILGNETDPQKRAELADAYIAKTSADNLLTAYGTTREQAQAYANTDEGKNAIERAGDAFSTLSNLRDDYLLDKETAGKGGMAGLEAVRRSRDAEGDIRTDAERYAGGDVSRYVALGISGATDAGNKQLETDFARLEPAEKTQMLARLKASDAARYADTKAGDLTVDDMRVDVDNRLKRNLGVMGESKDDMLAAVNAEGGEVSEELRAAIDEEAAIELTTAAKHFSEMSGLSGKDAEAIEAMQVAPDSNMEANVRTVSNALSKVGSKTYDDEAAVFGRAGLSNIEKLDSMTDSWNAEGNTMADKKAMADKFGYSYDEMEGMMRRTSHLGLSTIDADKGELTGEVLAKRMQGVSDRDIEATAKSEEDRTMRMTGTLEIVGTVNGQATVREMTGVTAR